jgi:hypothetical protein
VPRHAGDKRGDDGREGFHFIGTGSPRFFAIEFPENRENNREFAIF